MNAEDERENPPESDPDPSSSATEEKESKGNASETVVSCQNLTKTYRKFFGTVSTTAVNDVDLDIQKGEIFGLLGPNGSGKTTMMKLFLGLLFPDSGEANVLDRSPDNVVTKDRIGFLPEESYLYDFLTGRETLHFYGSLFGLSRDQRNKKVKSLLKEVDLWEDRNRPLKEYSKGMARRIGFAQAIINNPDVIFLDEPTVGLDPIIARELKNRMLSLRDEGKTIIVSSHVLADVEDVCDRVAILHEGVKQKEGQIEELLAIREQVQVTVSSERDPEQARDELRSLLEKNGWVVEGLSHPTRTLETLFLTTIEESGQ